jgi:Flp pilus assembly pilin Flp
MAPDLRGVTAIEYAIIAAVVVSAALMGAQVIAENVIMRAGRILAAL